MFVPIYIPTCSIQGFPLYPHLHQHLLKNYLFNNSHPNRYEVLSHCVFDFHFLVDQWCWIISSWTYWPFVYIFLINAYLRHLLLSCWSLLNILDIITFTNIGIANIFYQTADCIIILQLFPLLCSITRLYIKCIFRTAWETLNTMSDT